MNKLVTIPKNMLDALLYTVNETTELESIFNDDANESFEWGELLASVKDLVIDDFTNANCGYDICIDGQWYNESKKSEEVPTNWNHYFVCKTFEGGDYDVVSLPFKTLQEAGDYTGAEYDLISFERLPVEGGCAEVLFDFYRAWPGSRNS